MIEQYSLWLMPSGNIYDELDELIKKLSKKFNSYYVKIADAENHTLWCVDGCNLEHPKVSNKPCLQGMVKRKKLFDFPPHITLLGKLTLDEEKMMSRTQELSHHISPFSISLENIDYSEDYFRSVYVRAKKDASLLDANLKARKIFERENDEEYMPHLNILYSNITQKNKKSLLKNILDSLGLSFNVNKIYVYSTTGPVCEWFKLRSFDLRE